MALGGEVGETRQENILSRVGFVACQAGAGGKGLGRGVVCCRSKGGETRVTHPGRTGVAKETEVRQGLLPHSRCSIALTTLLLVFMGQC